jgi:hypothetical protein
MNILTNYSFENFQFTEIDFANKETVAIKVDGRWLTLSNKTQDEKIKNITLWVYNNIAYKADDKKNCFNGSEDWYQTPEETLLNRTGDCEDFAILIIGIAYSQLNIKMSLLKIKFPQSNHIVACWNNNVIECYNSFSLPTRGNINFVNGTSNFNNYVSYCEKYDSVLIEVILFDSIISKISEKHLESY